MLVGCTGTHQCSRQSTEPSPEGNLPEAQTGVPGQPEEPSGEPERPSGTPSAPKPTFWLGADISWATGMEKRGEYLYGFEGDGPVECSALMKDLGLNALRFRVWVDPAGGECDK